ncbi:MAG: glycyl-radical enzyme activating protein [Promethearchaeota archaeon]
MKGIIFDISHYAIYDGPSIRTIIFLKGYPLRCVWCYNPESQLMEPQISYFQEKCRRCGLCVENCPNNALQMSEEGVIRTQSLCKHCYTCIKMFPHRVMERIGEEKTVEEIIEIVRIDLPFYVNFGGGVTISGGEPTMQSKFLIALLEALKEENIHAAIETCGYFSESLLEKLNPLVDLFLFDIKHTDPLVHQQFTGVSNEKILVNFKKLIALKGNDGLIARIPLIPGFNTDLNSIEQIIQLFKDIRYEGAVHLMPYNKMAKTKYEKIGRAEDYKDMGDFTDKMLQFIVQKFQDHDFTVVVNH